MNNETLKRDLASRMFEGVKGELIHDLRENFECEDFVEDIEIFNKGAVWTYEGYSGVCIPLGEGDFEGFLIQHKSGAYTSVGKSIKPLLFPTSALTKEIQLANYNNGEPFVPIYELAKLFHTLSTDNIEAYTDAVEHGFYGAQCTCWISVKEGRCNYFQMPFGEFITSAEHRIIKMLYQWHINIELSTDQFIEVTEENNPYK